MGRPEAGNHLKAIKRALFQNAFAAITAKVTYRTRDGTERTLEAGFTRYSVVLTGKTLPDARRADAVYLVLNDLYREVLNSAPIRPLNYAYLKALAPAAQRFYEIISPRIFATLTNNNPFAKILYSDFCMYSALKRHFNYENFRVQMAQIHRHHQKSGYIAEVRYHQTTDRAGRPDWMMCYSPDPRAQAEYVAFARKSKKHDATIALPQQQLKPAKVKAAPVADTRRASTAQPGGPLPANEALIAEFTKRGVARTQAEKLLSAAGQNQQILDQLEWGDYQIQAQPGVIKNPGGFYVDLVRKNVEPPPTFETSRLLKLRKAAEQADQQKQMDQLLLEQDYEKDYQSQEIDLHIWQHVTEYELEQLQMAKQKEIQQQFKNLYPKALQEVVWRAVRAEIAKKVPFLTFKAYCEKQARQDESDRPLIALPAQEDAVIARIVATVMAEQEDAVIARHLAGILAEAEREDAVDFADRILKAVLVEALREDAFTARIEAAPDAFVWRIEAAIVAALREDAFRARIEAGVEAALKGGRLKQRFHTIDAFLAALAKKRTEVEAQIAQLEANVPVSRSNWTPESRPAKHCDDCPFCGAPMPN